MKIFKIALVAGLALAFTSCDFYDLDEASPNDALGIQDAFVDLASARGARAGLYNELQFNGDADLFDGWIASWQYFSDECDWAGTFPTREEFDLFSVSPSNGTLGAFYTEFYQIVNTANTLIDGVESISGDEALTPERRASLIAEGRFARALAYYYLTMGWQDVPLVLTPTTSTGEELFVTPTAQSLIFDQIEADLAAGSDLIAGETLGMNTAAANALLARVRLHRGDIAGAQSAGLAALGGPNFDLTIFPYLQDVLFDIEFSSTDGNSLAFFFFPSSLNGRYSIRPSDDLIAAYEPGDTRLDLSIATLADGTPYGIKYDDNEAAGGSQDDPILIVRHAEMVLTVGETFARQGDFTTAQMWLNQVRQRAGLSDITDMDASNFEDIFLQERYVELAMEAGHRLWDLRRTGRALDQFGSAGYEACDALWPFPQAEIDRNPNLVQNAACIQ